MKSIILNAHEAKAVREGKKTAFVVPVKPQPEFNNQGVWVFSKNNVNGCPFYFSGSKKHLIEVLTDKDISVAPYQIGQDIYVREPWHTWLLSGSYYYYDPQFTDRKLKSPATMPKEAAQTWLTVKGIEVVRVQDIKGDYFDKLNVLYTCPDCGGYGQKMMGGESMECTNILCGSENADAELFKEQTIAKHGQSAWDNNIWVFIVGVELKGK